MTNKGARVLQERLAESSWIVAMDGPSGTGKSTVSRGLAKRFSARYLDTGAMYRAVTFAALQAGIVEKLATNEQVVLQLLAETKLEISTNPQAPGIRVNGESVDIPIRQQPVTNTVSIVAAIAQVRQWLVAQQREIIAAESSPIVVEGRDIAAVVAPEAELKVYLTASESARAARRSQEQNTADTAGVLADIARRDHLDSTRAVDPLRRADGALEVDTTELDQQQVIELLAQLLTERLGAAALT